MSLPILTTVKWGFNCIPGLILRTPKQYLIPGLLEVYLTKQEIEYYLEWSESKLEEHDYVFLTFLPKEKQHKGVYKAKDCSPISTYKPEDFFIEQSKPHGFNDTYCQCNGPKITNYALGKPFVVCTKCHKEYNTTFNFLEHCLPTR